MQYGLFMMPMHLPEKSPAQAFDEDIDLLTRADALGYSEAWIGEHFTSAWENIPAPDLLIARVAPQLQYQGMKAGGRLALLKTDPTMPDEAVTPEFLLDRNWIAGDPDTCARKIREVYEKVGGFGHLLMLVYDWQPRQKMLTSLELLAKEVMPKLAALT